MIIEYSKIEDGNKKVAENFKVAEFACKDGSDKILICSELVEALQIIRNELKEPVKIISGYRTASYNTSINGAKNSQHLNGCACDISANTKNKNYEILKIILKNKLKLSVGIYKDFIHIDTREEYKNNRAIWIENENNTELKNILLTIFQK